MNQIMKMNMKFEFYDWMILHWKVFFLSFNGVMMFMGYYFILMQPVCELKQYQKSVAELYEKVVKKKQMKMAENKMECNLKELKNQKQKELDKINQKISSNILISQVTLLLQQASLQLHAIKLGKFVQEPFYSVRLNKRNFQLEASGTYHNCQAFLAGLVRQCRWFVRLTKLKMRINPTVSILGNSEPIILLQIEGEALQIDASKKSMAR